MGVPASCFVLLPQLAHMATPEKTRLGWEGASELGGQGTEQSMGHKKKKEK